MKFWEAYPLKAKVEEAVTAWNDLNPDGDCIGKILDAVEKQKQSDRWRRGIYSNPANWLRERGWLDELPPPPSTSDKPSQKETRAETLARLNAERAGTET